MAATVFQWKNLLLSHQNLSLQTPIATFCYFFHSVPLWHLVSRHQFLFLFLLEVPLELLSKNYSDFQKWPKVVSFFKKKFVILLLKDIFLCKSEKWKDISSEIILFNFSESYYFGDFLWIFETSVEKWPLLEPCMFLGAKIYNSEKTVRKIMKL